MAREIVVTTGARLHFGFLSCKPTSGRQFGGAGLMIDSPGFEIAVRASERFAIVADEVLQPRIEKIARACASPPLPSREGPGEGESVRFPPRTETSPPQNDPPHITIEVRSEIPPHAGLGSGTQLALAVGAAISALAGHEDVNPIDLAQRTARGSRSAIGIHGFGHGGFLIDAGKSGDNEIGSLAAHVDFPEAWRILLITPKVETGLAGSQERDAFARLQPMPHSQTDRLSSIALAEMLPAVSNADFDRCGEAIFEFGSIVGNYFAPIQGGTYATPSTRELIAHLRASGIRGVGQTSWGPTIFALCRNAREAETLSADLQSARRWHDCRFHTAAPKNAGARIRAIDV